jgi:hypothetical protein
MEPEGDSHLSTTGRAGVLPGIRYCGENKNRIITMANTLRSVNTKFWNDPFIEELTPSEKLLFLYLLTNPLCSLLGIYEISLKRIIYDTGLNAETIRKGFERFGNHSKAFYESDYVILPNFLKNQNLNKNMKVAVERQFNELPKWLKNKILGNGSEGLPNGSKGFERIRNGLVMVRKIEIEIEREIEREIEERNGKKKSGKSKLEISKEFYDEEIEKSKGQKFEIGYSSFVEFLFNKNKTGEPFSQVLSIPKQISYQNFETLMHDYPTKEDRERIKQKLSVMDNKPGFATKYRELYKTLINWMKTDY